MAPIRTRRPTPSAAVVDHALKLAEQGASGEAIDQALGLIQPGECCEVLDIPADAIAAIARDLFGSSARIESSERLGPLRQHGIQRRGGFTGNLVYKVRVGGLEGPLIFRFNRGLREDVYERERENYALVHEVTGVPGPAILHIDRSQRMAPTEFMVMEHVAGESATFLAHPHNPAVSQADKHRIRTAAGNFYGALHGRSRPAGDAQDEARRLVFGLHRLADIAPSSAQGIDIGALRASIEAVLSAPVLRCDTDTLCFMDAELLFARRGDCWELANVCDLEWVGYRDRYVDLLPAACLSAALWDLPSPGLSREALGTAKADPFFEAYQQHHNVDWLRLAAIIPYHQLALWAHALADQTDDAARAAIWHARGDLVTSLMRFVQR